MAASVEQFRAEYRDKISPRYRGWLHLAFTSTTSLAVIAFAASRTREVRPVEWLSIPALFLIANVAEYFGHKGPMHRPRRGLGLVYRRHTKEHHHFFTSDTMAFDSPRDFKFVLFPPVLIVFFLGMMLLPIALLLFRLASANVGWLGVATGMSYFLSYEWLHFAYHMPRDSWVARLPFMGALRRHHTRHHDLGLMGKYNFNITFPICDFVFGTTYRDG